MIVNDNVCATLSLTQVWYEISGAAARAALFPSDFYTRLSTTGASSQALYEIAKDIDRTFPGHAFFDDAATMAALQVGVALCVMLIVCVTLRCPRMLLTFNPPMHTNLCVHPPATNTLHACGPPLGLLVTTVRRWCVSSGCYRPSPPATPTSATVRASTSWRACC